ncbi:MAG: InlB B-repeat-containing protein, partial [Bacteroidales bacterium]|nr:InlB B-repeat-containing protein [Bacteroidales bacterium]
LITPVIYTVNLEEGQPITVRFRARSAKRVGGAGNPWTKGTVGDKYSAASLKVLVSNDGQFRNSDVIGTVNVGSDNIDSTLFEFDLTTPKTGSVQVAFYYANTSYINDNAQENNEDYMVFEIFDVRFEYKNDVAICPPLEGLERTFLTPHSATFSWAPSDSAKYYEFAYGPADEDEYANTVKLTDAEYTMTGLDDETTYKVKVTGYCDEDGENAAPDPLTAEFTTPEGCHTPTGFKVQDVTYYGATFISQQTQSILDEREIKVVSTDNLHTKFFKQPKDTLVQDKGLYDNTSYTAITRAICRYGTVSKDTSEWSNPISFTTLVDPANLPDTFDVKVVVAPAGAGVVTGAKKYVEDETISLTATANSGYVFKGWVDTYNDTVGREATYTRLAKLEDDEESSDLKTHVLEYKAVFKKVYTIAVNASPASAGTVTGAGTYDDGADVTLTATPKSTYVFQEWQDAEGNRVATTATYKFKPTANATYTAIFRTKLYYTLDAQVTPNADWGSVTYNPQPNEDEQYAEGQAVTLTAVPAQYCKFVAWKDADGNTLGTNTTYTVSMDANKAVKAEFAQIRYTVTLKSDPNTNYGTIKGTSGSTTTGGQFVGGSTRRLVAQPKSGYTFVKWMSGSQQLGTDTVLQFVLTRDTTITAYFQEKPELDIKVTVSPANAGTVTGAGKVKRGENAVLTATPAAHYAFKEWKRLDNSTIKNNPYTFKPDRDYTFTAVFRDLESFTVTVTQEGSGTVTGAGTYEEGQSVSLKATAAENYYFAEWQDADGSTLSTDETYTFTVTANTSVKAVFSENEKYQVSLSRNPSAGGTVSGAGSYHAGDEVTIAASPNKGYRFLYWEKKDGTQVTDNPYIFNALGRDMVFTAVFEALCEIKVTVDPAGTARVTGAGTYDAGDEVTLTATVDDEYVFVEWRDGNGVSLSTETTYTFTASTSMNITAVLREKAYYSIDVPCVGDDEDENDPGTISFSDGNDGEWMEGTTVTMTATPAQYYEFVEWQDKDGNTLSKNASYSFVISQDTTFTAVFSRLQYTVTLVSNPSKDYGTINGTSGSASDGGTFDAGSKRHLEAKPKSGYEFVKWMSDTKELGTNPVYEFILTEDITITAYFQEKQELDIKVTVVPVNAGTVTGAGKVQRGNNAVLTANPGENYKFLYWERIDGTQHEDNPYTLVQPKRDYSFTANFRTKNQYTVTVMPVPNNAAGTITKTGLLENGKALEDATVTLTANPAEGYTFVEWQDAAGTQVSTDATLTFTATANVVYKAIFDETPIQQYMVTLLRDPVAGGRISGDGEYAEGEEVSIRATANKGYTFVGWYNGTTLVSADNPYKFTLTADVTYTAKFTANPTVDVAVTVRLGGTVDPTVGTVTGAGSYEKGKSVTLKATPASEDYIFSGWRDLDNDDELISSENPYTFTPTDNVNYAAVFREKLEVTLNILPDDNAGTVTGAGYYPQGRSATIKAEPAEGYTFVGWLDEAGNTVTTETTYTFTMTGNVT